jgi:uncharacterized membrane protein
MQYVAAYITALVVFGASDAIWLSLMGPALYRPILGDILLPTLRVPPAVVFYAIFPVGIVAFAVVPALRTGAISSALLWGALFGAIAYATYDLTNYATLRNWTLQLTLVDVVYGALASAVAGGAATLAARLLSTAG